jgi:hypothetical protein
MTERAASNSTCRDFALGYVPYGQQILCCLSAIDHPSGKVKLRCYGIEPEPWRSFNASHGITEL